MNMKSIVLAIASLAVLVGCAGPHKYDPSQSKAWNITKAAGIDRLEDGKDVGLYSDNNSTGKAVTLGALNYLSPTAGLSSGVSGGLGLAVGLFAGGKHESQVDTVIAWMPKELASDAETAQTKMGRMLEAAAIKALPDGYKAKAYEWTDIASIGAKSHYRVIKVDGPLCPDWGCVMEGAFPTKDRLRRQGEMESATSPELPDKPSYPAWTYDESWVSLWLNRITKEYDKEGSTGGRWHKIETEPMPKEFDMLAWYARVTDNLPDWAYYYRAPTKDTPAMVLHQGKMQFFVQPGR